MVISSTKDYHECARCGITTATENRLCPCNRKSCDAIKKGTIVITKTIMLDDQKKVKDLREGDGDIGQIIASWNV